MPKNLKIKIAKTAGFCFGVKRAVEMAENALAKNGTGVFSLGPIIHNPQTIEKLEKKGLKIVDSPEEVSAGCVYVIRSHGIAPEIEKRIKEKKGIIFNATCPFVKRAQKTAENFYKTGKIVVICGDPLHAEVVGLSGYAKNKAIVIQDEKEADKLGKLGKFGVLSQTTQKPELFKKIAAVLTKKNANVEVVNTICLDSSNKKEEVKKLAKKVDIMLVIGGRNSNNTKKLAETSKAAGTPTHHIENISEIKKSWFKDNNTVGISAGASTPLDLINEAVEKLKSF